MIGKNFDELMSILEDQRSNGVNTAFKLLRGPKVKPDFPAECVHYLIGTNFDEFEKIVKASMDLIRENRIKNELAGDIGDLGIWYKKTAGILYVAIYLMGHMNAEDLDVNEVSDEAYVSLIQSLDKAKSSFNKIINSYVTLFRHIVKREFYKVSVILQPIANDELKKFYEICGGNLEDIGELSEDSAFVKVLKEEWKNNYINIYELDDLNLTLRNLFYACSS